MTLQPQKRVYVADDEKIIATTLALIFQQAGFAAAAYDDSMQLLAACEAAVPDAVVSDVMMPGMTGIQLALELNRRHPHCKVLLVSGQATNSELIREAMQRGHVFDVLAKPIPPAALIWKIRSALA